MNEVLESGYELVLDVVGWDGHGGKRGEERRRRGRRELNKERRVSEPLMEERGCEFDLITKYIYSKRRCRFYGKSWLKAPG